MAGNNSLINKLWLKIRKPFDIAVRGLTFAAGVDAVEAAFYKITKKSSPYYIFANLTAAGIGSYLEYARQKAEEAKPELARKLAYSLEFTAESLEAGAMFVYTIFLHGEQNKELNHEYHHTPGAAEKAHIKQQMNTLMGLLIFYCSADAVDLLVFLARFRAWKLRQYANQRKPILPQTAAKSNNAIQKKSHHSLAHAAHDAFDFLSPTFAAVAIGELLASAKLISELTMTQMIYASPVAGGVAIAFKFLNPEGARTFGKITGCAGEFVRGTWFTYNNMGGLYISINQLNGNKLEKDGEGHILVPWSYAGPAVVIGLLVGGRRAYLRWEELSNAEHRQHGYAALPPGSKVEPANDLAKTWAKQNAIAKAWSSADENDDDQKASSSTDSQSSSSLDIFNEGGDTDIVLSEQTTSLSSQQSSKDEEEAVPFAPNYSSSQDNSPRSNRSNSGSWMPNWMRSLVDYFSGSDSDSSGSENDSPPPSPPPKAKVPKNVNPDLVKSLIENAGVDPEVVTGSEVHSNPLSTSIPASLPPGSSPKEPVLVVGSSAINAAATT